MPKQKRVGAWRRWSVVALGCLVASWACDEDAEREPDGGAYFDSCENCGPPDRGEDDWEEAGSGGGPVGGGALPGGGSGGGSVGGGPPTAGGGWHGDGASGGGDRPGGGGGVELGGSAGDDGGDAGMGGDAPVGGGEPVGGGGVPAGGGGDEPVGGAGGGDEPVGGGAGGGDEPIGGAGGGGDEGEAGAGGDEGEAGVGGIEPPVGGGNIDIPVGGDAGDAGAPGEWMENDFVLTEEDHLATFSIDVDTASYTLARGALRRGRLPLPEAIRVEEFINYFDYGPEPRFEGAPFTLDTEVAPSPFGEGLHMLRLSLATHPADPDARPPSNLVFLVDVSGSMTAEDKLPYIERTLLGLVDALDPEDTIAIVAYASGDRVQLEVTPVSERQRILEGIAGLNAGGGTAGEAGIRAAYRLAEGAYLEHGNNRVILCTDGDFNVGLEGDELVRLVASWRDRGIGLTVLGVGRQSNDPFLEALSNQADGIYYFIDSAQEADRVVGDLATGALHVVAKEVKIQVDLNPEAVRRYRLVGYENRDIADDDFRDDTVDAGEIGPGRRVTAFIEAELREIQQKDGQIPLVTTRVRYKAPHALIDDPAAELARVHPVGAVLGRLEDASSAFRFGVAVVEFAEILRRSMHVGAVDLARVGSIAEGAAQGRAARVEFLSLVRIARGLLE